MITVNSMMPMIAIPAPIPLKSLVSMLCVRAHPISSATGTASRDRIHAMMPQIRFLLRGGRGSSGGGETGSGGAGCGPG